MNLKFLPILFYKIIDQIFDRIRWDYQGYNSGGCEREDFREVDGFYA